MALTRVAPAGIGSTPGTGYVIGDSFLHSTGLNATNAYYTGIVTTQTLRVIGDFQVDGTTTTLDTEVTSVDKLEVGANNNTVGVAITQSGTGDILNLYDSGTEVFSVTDGGKVKIGTTTEGQTQADDLTIATSGHTGMTIRSGTTSKGAIYFSDGTSGSSEYRGYVEYNHQDDFLRFGTAAVEKVRITSGGNVGINEDNPRHRLTVNSGTINVAIAVSSTDAGSYISYQDNTTGDTGTNSEVYAGALGGSFVIHTDAQNAPRVSVTNAGNVGINSTTPRAIVDFGPGTGNGTLNQTVANYQAVFEAPTGTGNYTRNIAFASRTSAISAAINAVDEGGSDATGLIVATGTAGSIAERLRITSSGNIGVNKTTPKEWYSTYKTLQIYDAAYIAGSSDDSFVAIGANNYLDTGGTYDYTNTDYASQLYQVDGQLVFRNAPSGTADTAITWAERFKVTSAGELNLSYGTINLGTADSSSGHINAYELMTFNIDSDNDDTNRHFTWYKNGASGGGTGMMRLDENGRLCIGGDLATSGNNLTLKHATGVEIDMHATSGSGNNFRVKSDSAGAFTIRDHSAGGDRLTITDSGDVLIGALTPIDTRNTGGIHIQHSRGISFRSNTTQSVSRNWRIRNDDYGWGNLDFSVGNAVDEWGDSAGDVVMSLTSNRNVGIGDLAPSEKLNVAGNIMLEGAEGFMYLSNVGTGNAGIYVRGNSSSNFLRSHSTGMFTWEVTGSEKMRLDAIGNLGLGCSPGNSAGYRTLQIGDGTNTGGQIWLKNGANANYYNWHDGTGVHFYGQSAGNLRFYTTATERFRIDSVGRALLGRQRTIGSGSYYDDLTINNSNTASGADGGAGIDLISGNDSWGGYIFSDSDAHARGYLKYDHGDDEMIFGTSSANRVTLDSGGRLLVGGSASTNPINANNTFALQVVGSYTNTGQQHGALFRYGENSANSSIIRFEKNRSNVGNNTSVQNGDNLGELQFYGVDNAGAYKLGAQIEAEVDGQNPANGTIPTRLVFKTTPAGTNNTPTERLRIRGDGSLEVNGSDFDDLIGCTGEHSGPNNTLYKTNSKTNLTTGTWYTIAILPSGRGFASFMIQDTSSSRHTCFYFNAGHQYGGNHNQNCINVIGCSGTHGTQVFGALRIKAYGTYDGAMLQVYIQSSVNQVKAYMVGENLAPQRWRMRDWIADGTDPTGLSNWSSIQSNASGLSAYADLNALAVGGASFSGPVLPGLNNIYVLGSGNRKWTTVYATTGSINTSDITLKRDVTVLNDAEMRAAANISKQFKQYRWKDAYAEKGDDARYHSGMMAQTVRDAMLGEGLDPTRYGFYCVDTWYEDPEGTKIDKFSPPGLSVDEDDPRFNTPDVGEPEIPENMSLVTGYSLRYEELLCFIAAYNEQRFASLESRLSALES